MGLTVHVTLLLYPSVCPTNRIIPSFRFMWPCIINVGEERTNRWHRYRCLFTVSLISTCFGHHYAHCQENRLYKTACGVSLDMLAAIVWSRDASWAHPRINPVLMWNCRNDLRVCHPNFWVRGKEYIHGNKETKCLESNWCPWRHEDSRKYN